MGRDGADVLFLLVVQIPIGGAEPRPADVAPEVKPVAGEAVDQQAVLIDGDAPSPVPYGGGGRKRGDEHHRQQHAGMHVVGAQGGEGQQHHGKI